MTTIYQVAERAGVSISTVSLALNSPERVRAATLQRVLAAADELGFVPKADAASRARRGIGRIGVVAPFTSYSSFSRRLNGAMQAVNEHPAELVVYDQESAAIASPRLASLPLTKRLDGLIVMALPLDDAAARRLINHRLPTVLVDITHPDFSSVSIDDAAGGRLAARHLLERGHREIGYIQEHKIPTQLRLPPEGRLTGFRDELAAHGVALPASRVRTVSHDVRSAAAAAAELLDQNPRPTAIFAFDDQIAVGALRAAHERGLRVPDDLAVVGFDDDELAECVGLTTIRQPLEESGRAAVNTLLAEIADPQRPKQRVTLGLSLVRRETT